MPRRDWTARPSEARDHLLDALPEYTGGQVDRRGGHCWAVAVALVVEDLHHFPRVVNGIYPDIYDKRVGPLAE